ncbi:MAG: radical SAM protein [Methylocystis sp.]|uniref:radical SAM protein n=1 Tax=Methylocystis sp. TaxID=1911079 RepID=UPI003D105B1E
MAFEFPNIFLLAVDDRHFLHAPRAELTIEVDQAAASTIDSILDGEQQSHDAVTEPWRDFLRNAAAATPTVSAKRNYRVNPSGQIDFQPTSATLSLTTGCNLRCVYCHIHGGEENRSMPIDVARAVISFVADNAARSCEETISFDFHGEGEPTFNWPLFREVVEYAESVAADRGLELNLGLQTNGLWNETQRAFICAKFDSISVSLDGLDCVQLEQRPTPNGKRSFPTIRENLIAMSKAGVPFAVRATVMPNSLDRMESLIDFLLERTHARSIGFEPVEPVGRGDGVDADQDFKSAFAARLLDAMGYGRKKGVEVAYSGCSHVAGKSFCGATGDVISMTVMADGTVSSCYEVPSEEHHLGGFFIFGAFNPAAGTFDFDQNRLRRLVNYRSTDNSPCGSCFAQSSCKGDCLTRRSMDALLNGGFSSRCSVNKTVAKGAMILNAETVLQKALNEREA